MTQVIRVRSKGREVLVLPEFAHSAIRTARVGFALEIWGLTLYSGLYVLCSNILLLPPHHNLPV